MKKQVPGIDLAKNQMAFAKRVERIKKEAALRLELAEWEIRIAVSKEQS